MENVLKDVYNNPAYSSGVCGNTHMEKVMTNVITHMGDVGIGHMNKNKKTNKYDVDTLLFLLSYLIIVFTNI